jgi:demethylmenaquinone methyltransferase/2-methoxy-6-polyprenyl-1,4-benzoquinol methylase
VTHQTPQASEAAAWTRASLEADPHRDPDKATRVQAMFGAIAHAYDLNNRLHSFGLDQWWRRRTVREVARRLGRRDLRGTRVLDVACGTGDLSEAFAESGALVTGVDYTPRMLDLARHKAQRRAWRRGTCAPSFLHGDATDLDQPKRAFDAVTIAFGLRNVGDVAAAMGEFRRVLRPGGVLAVLEFDQPAFAPARWFHRLYTERIMPWTATWIARDRSGAYHYLPRSVDTFVGGQGIAAEAVRAGFHDPRVIHMTMGTCALVTARRASV